MPAQNEIPRFSELSVPYTQGFYMSAECPAQLITVHAWIKQTDHEPIPTAEEVASIQVIHQCSKNQTLFAGGSRTGFNKTKFLTGKPNHC